MLLFQSVDMMKCTVTDESSQSYFRWFSEHAMQIMKVAVCGQDFLVLPCHLFIIGLKGGIVAYGDSHHVPLGGRGDH